MSDFSVARGFLRVLPILILVAGVPGNADADHCVEFPPCKGCGCRGGPGYRAPNKACVGYVDLTRVCGTPPSTRCTFENEPKAGVNEACVREHRARGAAPAARP